MLPVGLDPRLSPQLSLRAAISMAHVLRMKGLATDSDLILTLVHAGVGVDGGPGAAAAHVGAGVALPAALQRVGAEG